MTQTILPKSIEDLIADLSRRVDNLETGAKQLTSLSPQAAASVTLNAGQESNAIGVTLNWANSIEAANQLVTPYWAVFIDNNNDVTYEWKFGSNLSSGQRNCTIEWFMDEDYVRQNQSKARLRLAIKNNDSVQHTYYIKARFSYLATSGGS